MSAQQRKIGLGKGLSALLQDSEDIRTTSSEKSEANTSSPISSALATGNIGTIPIDKVKVNPFQPRTEFDEEALAELSESIQLQGLIQPITVRKNDDNTYQLISGERRLRASKLAGLTTIPAYVRTANDQQMLEMALIENIQRENLNAIEVAMSFRRMMEECSLKQEELGERVSKNRSTVTNYLRLLKLPPVIQAGIRDGQISMGHARAIVGIPEVEKQLFLYEEILKSGLSVRKTEELAKRLQDSSSPGKRSKTANKGISFQYQKIEDDLASRFSSRVRLKVSEKKNSGAIEIPFHSEEDLNRILELLDW